MSPPCKVKSTSVIELKGSHVLIDGHKRANLDGCTLPPGARIVVKYSEVHEAPKRVHRAQKHVEPPAPPAPPAPIEPSAPVALAPTPQAPQVPSAPTPQATSIKLPPEFAELQALADLYSVSQTMGLPVALALGAYMLIRGKTPKKQSDKGPTKPCPRSPDVDLLTVRVEALEQMQRSNARDTDMGALMRLLASKDEEKEDRTEKNEEHR
jgi:hypothetical protein